MDFDFQSGQRAWYCVTDTANKQTAHTRIDPMRVRARAAGIEPCPSQLYWAHTHTLEHIWFQPPKNTRTPKICRQYFEEYRKWNRRYLIVAWLWGVHWIAFPKNMPLFYVITVSVSLPKPPASALSICARVHARMPKHLSESNRLRATWKHERKKHSIANARLVFECTHAHAAPGVPMFADVLHHAWPRAHVVREQLRWLFVKQSIMCWSTCTPAGGQERAVADNA